MKKITILNQDSGYLMIDLANAFDDAGYEVVLITGRLVQRNTPLNESISLNRVAEYRKSNIFYRVLSWTSAFLQMIYYVWLGSKEAHLLIVSNPPISPLIPFFVRNSYSFLFYDIYIDTLGKFLLFGNKSILSLIWVSLHKMVLKKAKAVFALTDGMKLNIENYVDDKIIIVIPIWTDGDFLKPISKNENLFVSNNNLEDKFIVLYSGNIGLNNGLEIIMDVAKKVKNPKVQFLIVGDGIGKSNLVKLALKLNLKNVKFLNWQPTYILPYSLAAADIAIVTLSPQIGNNAIPSKFFNFLSIGAPILSIADEESDLAKLVKLFNVGRNFQYHQLEDIVDFIELIVIEDNPNFYRSKSLEAVKYFSNENARLFVDEINFIKL
jgi:glycosyltransferase involved in cell wall biosynthesis